ncbi:hypothetical protein D9M72_394270 [compost metagenome]
MTGPNSVECSPIRKVPAYSSGALCQAKPARPSSMMAISSDLTSRIRRDFSSLSAICPLVAENSTNGAIKMAEIRKAALRASTPSNSAVW